MMNMNNFINPLVGASVVGGDTMSIPGIPSGGMVVQLVPGINMVTLPDGTTYYVDDNGNTIDINNLG